MTIRTAFALPAALALTLAGFGPAAVRAADLQVYITTPDGKPAPDVVVAVLPLTGAPTPAAAPTEPAVIAQKDIRFQPYVTAVPLGTSVRFVNRDRFDHHVKSVPGGPLGSIAPAKEFEFRLAAARGGSEPSAELKMDVAGATGIGCHLHGSMRAHIYVSPTPWVAVTNAAGRAKSDFTRYKNYFVLVSLNGYITSERLMVADNLESGKLRFSLREQPPCMRAGGVVLTQKFGTRIANANLKFIHGRTGFVTVVRTNLNGEFDACLPEEGDYTVYVERDGFKPDDFHVTARPNAPIYEERRLTAVSPEAESTADTDSQLARGLKEGSVIVMDKIFYEYNKATLNYSAVRHMDALFELLSKYPEMEVDLVSHTDTRGDEKLNMELTDERSKNAKTYLVYRGIQAERIGAYGKGETEPRNRCVEGVECSDEEHQQNNRLEVKIRKMGKRP